MIELGFFIMRFIEEVVKLRWVILVFFLGILALRECSNYAIQQRANWRPFHDYYYSTKTSEVQHALEEIRK